MVRSHEADLQHLEQAHRVRVGVGRDGAVYHVHVENKIKFCAWPEVKRTCLAKLTISDNSKDVV